MTDAKNHKIYIKYFCGLKEPIPLFLYACLYACMPISFVRLYCLEPLKSDFT